MGQEQGSQKEAGGGSSSARRHLSRMLGWGCPGPELVASVILHQNALCIRKLWLLTLHL